MINFSIAYLFPYHLSSLCPEIRYWTDQLFCEITKAFYTTINLIFLTSEKKIVKGPDGLVVGPFTDNEMSYSFLFRIQLTHPVIPSQ